MTPMGCWASRYFEPYMDELNATAVFEYTTEDRAVHLQRLDEDHELRGHEPPGSVELAGLQWPQRDWWQDRDRILFLNDFLSDWRPTGHHVWEEHVLERAATLWGVGDGELCQEGFGTKRVDKAKWAKIPAPGWRYLTSFACCPRLLRISPLVT